MRVVNGFIRADGRMLKNDSGEIILRGYGIGNWLLCEGYMWLADGRMDRPHRLERVIHELLGSKKAKAFWEKFRENYFTIDDLKYLKDRGYNSIRLPINWPLFMEDEPGVIFKEEGFKILDKVVSWCKKADMYVLIDLHGAPGGQTGSNIDDSIDEMPRLLMDEDKFEKGLALWEEIARRYRNEPVVGAYDLLNEPIREGDPSVLHLVPELIRFYDEAIKRIRAVDTRHVIALEGHHWSTQTDILNHRYDENYCLHFHRYGVYPEAKQFARYLDASKKWNIPLWLGETGENKLEWFSAISQLCEEYRISYHFWPYKKMGKTNGSVTIKTPKDWDAIIAYSKGAKHPGYEKAERILNEFLDNLPFKNCLQNDGTDKAILRNGRYVLRATDFAEREGSFRAHRHDVIFNSHETFRHNTGIPIVEAWTKGEGRYFFDSQWDRFNIVLTKGEFVSYHAPRFKPTIMEIHGKFEKDFRIQVNGKDGLLQDGKIIVKLGVTKGDLIKMECVKGTAQLDCVVFI